MRKWLFLSHGLAFILGGVVTLAVAIAIGNLEAQWLYQEAEAKHKEAQRRYQELQAARAALAKMHKATEDTAKMALIGSTEPNDEFAMTFLNTLKRYLDSPDVEPSAELCKTLKEVDQRVDELLNKNKVVRGGCIDKAPLKGLDKKP